MGDRLFQPGMEIARKAANSTLTSGSTAASLQTVNGRAVSDRLVRATLPDNAELFNQFRYGNQLVARVEGNPEARFQSHQYRCDADRSAELRKKI